MDYKKMFKGEFISAVEFEGRSPTLTMVRAEIKPLASLKPGEEDKFRDRGVLYFKETDRGMVLNRTNAECIAAMFGSETDQWAGMRLTLHSVLVQVGPKREPGIRIKGSPDLKEKMVIQVKLPRKRPIPMTMEVTSVKGPQLQQDEAA